MSYLLAKIIVCLLLAGLLGAIIGWFLRGGCSKRLRECEDDWKMKMGSLESEWDSKYKRLSKEDTTQYEDTQKMQAATLKRHAEHVETQKPSYSYEQELKERLQQSQTLVNENDAPINTNGLSTNTVLGTVAAAGATALASGQSGFDAIKSTLSSKGVQLSDEKAKLYAEHGVDLNQNDLEEDYDIESLENLDMSHAQKLQGLGITSTKGFSKLHNNPGETEKVAKALAVDTSTVESWVGKSCLLELPGVDHKTANMMHNAGITSPALLTQETPEVLHKKMQDYNQQALIPGTVPDVKTVSLWSKVSKPMGLATAAVSADAASSYANELKAKLQPTSVVTSNVQGILKERGITLDDTLVQLYQTHDVNFKETLHLEDDYDIEALEGIGSKYGQALKSMGLSTTKNLVSSLHKDYDKIDQVAKSLKIQPETISSWISMADLIRLPGVDAHSAELLQTVGIDNVSELAVTNTQALRNEMVSFNKKSPIVSEVPTQESLQLWNKIAKEV